MKDVLTCISIDDDKLFLRKLEAFIHEIEWLTLLETHNHPVQGATAVISKQPDILFLDMEMPHVDGNYLMDWIEPKLAVLSKRPKVIIISSLKSSEVAIDKMPNVSGYINKYQLNSPAVLSAKLEAILN